MSKWIALASLAFFASGCASGGLTKPPALGTISVNSELPLRVAYYEKVRVQELDEVGYVIDGQVYGDRAAREHFKAFKSREAIAMARSATGARVARNIASIVPAPVGLVIGAYVGLIASVDSYSYNNNDLGRNVGIGALLGALLGGLAVSLPVGLTQHHLMEERRKTAAALFNADLKRKLRLVPDPAPGALEAPPALVEPRGGIEELK